jgi:hypothetical protein
MAFSITQTPATVNLSQSPVIYTVFEDTPVITSSSFQYVGELYYWTGSLTQSGSAADYTVVKYPNTSGRGIFDLNRIIYSTLTDPAIANTSNVRFFAVDFYWQYLSGSVYETGSHTKSATYSALDGYSIFQEPIGQAIENKTPFWPLMTDGPDEQDVLSTNIGTIALWRGIGSTTPVNYLIYSSSLGNSAVSFTVPTSTNTSGSVYQIPAFPAQSGSQSFVTSSLVDWYSIQLGTDAGGAVPITPPIRFNVVCNEKYPNVRIKWKNRYGQFDYLNFNLVSRQSFETTKRTYQPQLGSWEGTSLSYNDYDSGVQNYISDSKQMLSVNTNWLTEDYNDILKQLMVSDEIYWVYDEPTTKVRPLTISTSNIVFKTGVVDKLIQYQFDFDFGQAYKLII